MTSSHKPLTPRRFPSLARAVEAACRSLIPFGPAATRRPARSRLVESLEPRRLLASIEGSVFVDVDGNAVKDANEAPLRGWVAYLDSNNNSRLDVGEPSATSDSNGDFHFIGLQPGQYRLTVVEAEAWGVQPKLIDIESSEQSVTGVDLGSTVAASHTPVAIPGPLMTVTNAPDVQSGAYVGMDATGRFAIVWRDVNDIRAQFYLADGTPAGPVKVLASHGGSTAWPVLAMNLSGQTVIVWQGTGAWTYFAQTFQSDGTAISGVFPVSAQGNSPAVDINEVGRFVIAQRQGDYISSQVYNVTGSAVTGVAANYYPNTFQTWYTSYAAIDDSGRYVIGSEYAAWFHESDGSTIGSWVEIGTWTRAVALPNGAGYFHPFQDGSASPRVVRGGVYSSAGTRLQPFFDVSTTPITGQAGGAISGPFAAVDIAGNVVASWGLQNRTATGGGGTWSTTQIVYRKFDSNLSAERNDVVAATLPTTIILAQIEDAFGPRVAAGPWNAHALTWSWNPGTGTNTDVFVQTRGLNGRVTTSLFVDANGNGYIDPNERDGVGDVRIELYKDDGDGIFEPDADDQLMDVVISSSDGLAIKPVLGFGDYWARLDHTSPGMVGFSLYDQPSVRRIAVSANAPDVGLTFPLLRLFTVSTAVDEFDVDYSPGDLSLREALYLAKLQGVGLVLFDESLSGATIELSGARGQLSIASNLTLLADHVTIAGDGARLLYVESGINAVLDGIHLKDGNALNGGSLYVSEGSRVTLTNSRVTDNNASRRGGAFFVASGGHLELQNVSLSGNQASLQGGAIFIDADASVSLSNVVIHDNAVLSGEGGGIASLGDLVAGNTTLFGNQATHGAGIAVLGGNSALTNVTLSGNRVSIPGGAGGGLYAAGGSALLGNTIAAGNLRHNEPDDVWGALDPNSSFNLLGVEGTSGLVSGVNGNLVGSSQNPLDAKLMPLADYGGAVQTMPPRQDSPAIESGSNAVAASAGLTTDAAGNPRFRDFDGDGGATVDRGAFELSSVIIVDALLDESEDTDSFLSLREAIALAAARPGLDTIQFSPTLIDNGKILLTLTHGELLIESHLDLQGRADVAVIIDGGAASRVIRVAAGGRAILTDLTIRGGHAISGGGVLNVGGLRLHRVLLEGNLADLNGGAIWNDGTLEIENSTISGNAADGAGGGLFVAGGAATLVNTTVYGNRANADDTLAETGGGVVVVGGVVTLTNTVVAKNIAGTANVAVTDVSGAFDFASSYNFIGAITGSTGLNGAGTQAGSAASPIDPLLLALTDNGGPTKTHAQQPASPVTDAGTDAAAVFRGMPLRVDQRGQPRVKDGNDDGVPRIDIGAFEQQFPLNRAPTLTNVELIKGAAEARPFVLRYETLLAASNAFDADAGDVVRFVITSIESGTLSIDGAAVTPGVTTLSPSQSLTWTPPEIQFASGEVRRVMDAFGVVASDGRVTSASPVPVRIEVTSVGQAVNYAVLFSGGDRMELNYAIYLAQLQDLYQTMTTRYGVEPSNVFIIYADGTASAPDQRGNVNSDMSFAAGSTILPATRNNLRQTLVQLANVIDANDHFLFWCFDHGLGDTGKPAVMGEEIIKGWGPSQDIRDDELAVWLQGLGEDQIASQYGVAEDYAGILAAYSTYVFAQCFGGGMLDNLQLDATRFGMSASNHYEASYADYFAGAFNRALQNGFGRTAAAFQFAVDHDARARRTPYPPNGGAWQFNVEHPWSGGGDFPIFASPVQNAAPNLRGVLPLKLDAVTSPGHVATGGVGAGDLVLSYDLLKAATDVQDGSGKAVRFRVTSLSQGSLFASNGQTNVSPNSAAAVVDLTQSIRWRNDSSVGTISAFSIVAIGEDGMESTPQLVKVRIGAPTSGPIARVDAKAIQSNQAAVELSVRGNDSGNGITVIQVGQPRHGTVTLDTATGQLRYTPVADFIGEDSFTYAIGDGQEWVDGVAHSDLATVKINVVSYNPDMIVTSDVRYVGRELAPPPGWQGMTQIGDPAYLGSRPAWRDSYAAGITNGFVLVRVSRPDNHDTSFNAYGGPNASHLWPIGDIEPQFGETPTAYYTQNTQMLMYGAPGYVHNGLPVYNGVYGQSVIDAGGLAVVPSLRYDLPNNAQDPPEKGKGGIYWDVNGAEPIWQEFPDDPKQWQPVDLTTSFTNAGQVARVLANLNEFATVWNVSLENGFDVAGADWQIFGPMAGGTGRSAANAMSDTGAIVGRYEYADAYFRAFMRDAAGNLIDIGLLPGLSESDATGISPDGTHVIGYGTTRLNNNAAAVAFRWSATDGLRSLGTLPGLGAGAWSIARGVNDNGIIVGTSGVGAGDGFAFVYVDGTMYDLNQLVQDSLPGVTLTEATSINTAGQIAATGRVMIDGVPHYRAYFLDIQNSLSVVSDAVSATNRAVKSFNVLANDSSGLSVTGVDQTGLLGTLAWDSAGLMTFDPGTDFLDLAVGATRNTSFTYSVINAQGRTATATVTITVTGVSALGTFHVEQFAVTPSGVDLKLSTADLDLSVLNLYGGQTAPAAADLTLVGQQGGPVRGSLAWNPATRTLSFIATGSVLPADTYTLTAVGSRPDALRSTAGRVLDGDANNADGGDFIRNFTVAATTARIVTLPDFTRGPDQPINLPADVVDAGIPIRISDGAGIVSVQFDLLFDPALMTVNSVVAAAGLPSSWTIVGNLIAPGRYRVGASSGSALTGGARDLFRIRAGVPAGALDHYGTTNVLRIADLHLNGSGTNEIPSVADVAVHKVAFLGDTTGNRSYSGLDASLVLRQFVQLDTGFDAFAMTDPRIIADIDGDGSLAPYDAALIAGKSIGGAVPQIPDRPAVALTPISGPDPLVTITGGSIAPGAAGDAILTIDQPMGLQALDLTIDYATLLFDVLDIQQAALFEGWALQWVDDAAAGRVTLTAYAATPIATAASGPMLVATLQAMAGSGSGPLILEGALNEGALEMSVQNGVMTIASTALGVAGQFHFETAQEVRFSFDQDIGATFDLSDVVLTMQDGQPLPAGVAVQSVHYDPLTRTGVVKFNTAPLPRGRYRLTLQANSVSAAGGATNPTATTVDFFMLPGDANRDGAVTFSDLLILAQNYGQSGRTWSTGDFNYNGTVEFGHLLILAQQYNVSLALEESTADRPRDIDIDLAAEIGLKEPSPPRERRPALR